MVAEPMALAGPAPIASPLAELMPAELPLREHVHTRMLMMMQLLLMMLAMTYVSVPSARAPDSEPLLKA